MGNIQWTDETWNPVRGCSRVSDGCTNCYAMGQAHRFAGPGKPYEGLTTIRRGKVDWQGSARLVPEMLSAPLKWKKPRRIFVNSMSDLFHESLSFEEIAAVFGVMAACPQHTFQVLTKRPKRALEFFEWAAGKFTNQQRGICMAPNTSRALLDAAFEYGVSKLSLQKAWDGFDESDPWPLPKRVEILEVKEVVVSVESSFETSARISACGTYRYMLTRQVQEAPHGSVTGAFLMLNPSTADAEQDDPTIRRCMGFARQFGWTHLQVFNLFALRSTDPALLVTHDDPVGPENDEILASLHPRLPVVAAWGAHKMARERGREVLRIINRQVMCLKITKHGDPAHPLYLPANSTPRIFHRSNKPQ